MTTQMQEWITNALLLLMSKKNYKNISVVDIVAEAHIGRRTFYRHFKTKDEILLLYCQTILQDFAHFILCKKELTLYSVSLSYFEFCQKHFDFLKLLQQSNMLHFIGDRLPDFLSEVAIMIGHVLPEQVTATYEKQDIYYYAYYFDMGGYWNITTLWLKKNQPEPPEEMAKMIVDIIYRTL